MIVPTRRAVAVWAGAFPLALLPVLGGARLWPIWAGALVAALGSMSAEWLLGRPRQRPRVQARGPAVLYVGDRDLLGLEIGGEWLRPVAVEVVCDFDEILGVQPAVHGQVGREPALLQVPLVPCRRGTATVHAAWLRWRGPLRLLQWTERRPLDLRIAVLPNVRAVRTAALRFFTSRHFLAGLKVERQVGDGSEFESLREHAAGLDSRAIDWKASARHHKLLGRHYRAERNHPVVLAVDAGRLMSEPLRGIPKLDHAINATLLLAYVALKTGDRVGLFAFDDAVRMFVEPQGNLRAFPRIQRHTADIAYSQAETNFTLGLLELGRRLRRRSLVVVLTDFVDTVTAELMVENLARLGRTHLALFVALRDTSLDAVAGGEPRSLDDLNRAMTAQDLAREREGVLGRLRRHGVHCLDGTPGDISTRLINRYLDVKRRELV